MLPAASTARLLPATGVAANPLCSAALAQDESSFEYFATEHFRLSGVYWGLTALHLLGRQAALDGAEIVAWVLGCQKPCGGFGGSERHDAHLLYTLSALQASWERSTGSCAAAFGFWLLAPLPLPGPAVVSRRSKQPGLQTAQVAMPAAAGLQPLGASSCGPYNQCRFWRCTMSLTG